MSDTVPNCPSCNIPMSRKQAKRGPNAGGYFYGCPNWRSGGKGCNETINIQSNHSETLDQNPVRQTSPQKWKDQFRRLGWSTEYTTIGALPSYASLYNELDIDNTLKKLLSQSFILEDANRERYSTEESNLISSLLLKIAQRGSVPLCSNGLEEAIIKKFTIEELLDPKERNGDISRSLRNQQDLEFNSLQSCLANREQLILDDEFLGDAFFDSSRELNFFTKWVYKNISSEASNWLIPQADLDAILSSYGLPQGGNRRIDFLFCHPKDTFAIELDGDEHNDSINIDQERDDALATCKIDVIRIKNSEFDAGSGPQLSKVVNRCLEALDQVSQSNAESPLNHSIKAASNNSKLQLCLIKAIKYGWVDGKSWNIKVTGLDDLSANAIADISLQIKAFDYIYDTNICPKQIYLSCDSGKFVITPYEQKLISSIQPYDELSFDVHISIQNHLTPLHAVIGESNIDSEDMIVRSAYLPVNSTSRNKYLGSRQTLQNYDSQESLEQFEPLLETFLRDIFRKSKFRDSQLLSILTTLRQIDSVVLLPTGAGKSFIYQLSGLLMPGITIIVDPIISLMEDQADGLKNYGIDKVETLQYTKDLNEKLDRCGKGEFHFILHSPERLQTPKFREKLRTLAQSTMINLAVIDEAHCVSEWGHDFRTAYLNVGNNIRNFCKDRNGSFPPILSLTGTASRSVLRDVLSDLNIDTSIEESIIRPASFDRKELNFYSTVCEPSYSKATLTGAIDNLSERFNTASNLFTPNKKQTFSGIVFVPHTNGKVGVLETQSLVSEAIGEDCNIYSGGNPYKSSSRSFWESEKRMQIKEFKDNKVSTLVSTKAYGMGIDKPNIRYTIHYGIPSSIESFYQEAGRAGRNRMPAHCGIVFSEYSEENTNLLLDSSIGLEDLRARHNALSLTQDDDVKRQLYFHLGSFKGAEKEIELIDLAIKHIGDFNSDRDLDINFADIGQSNNKNANFRNDEIKQTGEKSLFRLVKIGVLNDYSVDSGRKIFSTKINKFNLLKSKDVLLDYVAATAPGRQEEFKKQLSIINSQDIHENIIQLSRAYINFIYDIIERSRRASLREMVALARKGSSDKVIRSLILDYLQEGVGAEEIESLINQEAVNLKEWMSKLLQIENSTDARELRGMVMRFRESYPDHPGLLLLRSITEMLCKNPNQVNAKTDLISSIKFSIQKYSINPNEMIEILEWLLSFSKKYNFELKLVISCAFLESLYGTPLFKDIHDNTLSTTLKNTLINRLNKEESEAFKISSVIYQLDDIKGDLSSSVSNLKTALKDKELINMIN